MAAEVVVRRGLDVRLDVWLERLTDPPAPTERITGDNQPAALKDGRRIRY